MRSFKALAPSGHMVIWTHAVGETKTKSFLRTRPTASAVIKYVMGLSELPPDGR